MRSANDTQYVGGSRRVNRRALVLSCDGPHPFVQQNQSLPCVPARNARVRFRTRRAQRKSTITVNKTIDSTDDGRSIMQQAKEK